MASVDLEVRRSIDRRCKLEETRSDEHGLYRCNVFSFLSLPSFFSVASMDPILDR